MAFFSIRFAVFLFVFLGIYWAVHKHRTARVGVIILASYAFYSTFNPLFLLLLFYLSLQDWFLAQQLNKIESPGKRKALTALSIVGSLGLLCVFKYTNFFINIPYDIAEQFGAYYPERPHYNIPHPIGLSFYALQTISYIVDVYRRRIEPNRSFLDHLLYMSFFPRLLVGPIVRAEQFVNQIGQTPKVTREQFGMALFLLAGGLIKKQLLADYLALNLTDKVFDIPLMFSATEVLLAIFSNLIQIYCDFSGYTDIALGLALLMGYQLPSNFNFPFKSVNLREFWRRWHITLSMWLRDYLYIPLGGSRVKQWRVYFNLLVTFTLAGLWHGATWGWVAWGSVTGIGLIITHIWHKWRHVEKAVPEDMGIGRVLGIAGTTLFMLLSTVLIHQTSFQGMKDVYQAASSGIWKPENLSYWVPVIIVVAFIGMYFPDKWYLAIRRTFIKLPIIVQILLFAAVIAFLFKVASASLVPFVYGEF